MSFGKMGRRSPGIGDLFENLPDFFADLDDGLFADGDDSLIPPSKDDWIYVLGSLKSQHSKKLITAAAMLRCTLVIDTFDASGHIEGTCKTHSRTERVFVDLGFDGDRYGAGCSCNRSKNGRPCEHTLRFIAHVIKVLSDSSSSLTGAIDENTPNSQLVNHKALLADLDDFIARQRAKAGSASDVADPEDEVTRLVWKITTESGSLELTALKQRPKKRGGGWTKGQAISPKRLLESPELIQSAVDKDVVAAIGVSSAHRYYYQPEYGYDLTKAIEALAGHDFVMLNDALAEVQRLPFGIRVVEQDDLLRIVLALPGEQQERFSVFGLSEGLVACSADRPLVIVCRCDQDEADLAHQLLTTEVALPRQRLDDLKRRLDAIGQEIPVEWPQSLAGPIEPEETNVVALLRSRENGRLDCGIRVRDSRGGVHLPAQGVMHYADTRDGAPVQRRRDATQELVRAQKAVTNLSLDKAHALSPWNWRMLDFDQALGLLELLETKADSLGIEAAWDPKSEQSLRVLGPITAQNVRVEVSRKKDWFGLSGACRLGDEEFQLADLLQAVSSEPVEGFLELKSGQWARISAELRRKLQHLRDAAHTNRKKLEIDSTAAPIVQDLLEEQIDFQSPKVWRDCLVRLEKARNLNPTPPESFRGELRDYQLDGYRWLRRLAEWQVGGCLADDMGLGKTIQALAVLLDRAETGPALVVAPTSVGFNWVREAERFAPALRPHLYRETARSEFVDDVGPGDLVICTYGLALRDAAALSKVKWGTLILDEAQFVKNSRSKTAQAIRTIDAQWKLALTGTPMENHLGELWSLFRNVSPGLFGAWDQFRQRFAAPIEKDNDQDRRIALSRVIRPFVLRRTKAEVLTELPERTETNLYVDLSDQERRRYDEMRLAALGELGDIAGLPDTKDQRFRVLALLTRLRQLSCNVGLVDKSWTGGSAKLELLVETLQELKEEGHRALVFSQFTQHLGLIRQALEEHNISYEYLDGATPAKTRQQRIDKFQEGGSDAFLISLKAGGTGLNLTAADYAIHMDPWWNPAVEDQATDRAHRIGQTRPVMVYRIIARGTIEEQILDLHDDKRGLVAGVLEGTQAAGGLSTDELISLIREQ